MNEELELELEGADPESGRFPHERPTIRGTPLPAAEQGAVSAWLKRHKAKRCAPGAAGITWRSPLAESAQGRSKRGAESARRRKAQKEAK
jgi:hypothetical protein